MEIQLSLKERRFIVENWLYKKKRHGFSCSDLSEKKVNELLIKLGYDSVTESYATTTNEFLLLKMIRTPGITLYLKSWALKSFRNEQLNNRFRVISIHNNGTYSRVRYFRDYRFTVEMESLDTRRWVTEFDHRMLKTFSFHPEKVNSLTIE